jgi:hypothetical protein
MDDFLASILKHWDLIPDYVKEKINADYEQKPKQTYGTCSYCGGSLIHTEIEGIFGVFCSDCAHCVKELVS